MQGVVASSASANTPLHFSVAHEGFRVEAPRDPAGRIFCVRATFLLQVAFGQRKTIYSKSFYRKRRSKAMIEKTTSINDVARMAGVSPATVSNVLTGRKPVSAKLVKRVEAAVKALDYRADPLASMLRSGEAKIIAVVVPDLDNPFFTSVVSAVEQCLGPEAYEVFVASSHGEQEVEKSRLKAILAWRPAGLIVIPCSDDFPGRDLIESSRDPLRDRRSGDRQSERRHRLGRQPRGGRHWRSASDRPRSQRSSSSPLLRWVSPTFGNAAAAPVEALRSQRSA